MRDDEVYRRQKQVKRLYRRVQRVQPVVEGLSYSALQVLVAVEQADRALRPGGLAAELQMTSSNVAAALRSLGSRSRIPGRTRSTTPSTAWPLEISG